MERHRVIMAPRAQNMLLTITSKDDAQRVARRLEALSTAPLMGAIYDPDFESGKPPYEMRATYAGHYGIYYTYNATTDEVHVDHIIDSRRDPRTRFQE